MSAPTTTPDPSTPRPATRLAFRTCPLCEASCGLEITLRTDANGDEHVHRIRGDRDDVFSRGFICPKGSTLKQLHEDPDRLRAPRIKRDGVHVEVTWDEAWREIERRLDAVIAEHGRESLAVYLGNPSAHSLSSIVSTRGLLAGLGTRQRFSASTVDQMPRHVASGFVYGSPVNIPVPDLDRTDYLLILGANPYASNGSICTAPDFPGRIQAIRARGGTVVVVDPRRSKTAEESDRWISIRPGTDAYWLAAIANVLFADGVADPGRHLDGHVAGLDAVRDALVWFTPENVEAVTGVEATITRTVARELVAAPSAAVYGRIGTTTTAFGSTTSWLVDVVNTISGNLDRPGGAMFATPAAGGPNTRGAPGTGRGFAVGRGTSRVSGHPEVMGEYPAAALAEEIRTPGTGRIRALVTIAGNPVLSTPNNGELDSALDELDLMISVDMYLNETTRFADVILPVPSQLQRSHYDVLLMQFAVRNVANYSPAVLPLDPGQPDEWEIIAKLAMIAQRIGADSADGDPARCDPADADRARLAPAELDPAELDPAELDTAAVMGLLRSAVRDEHSPVAGREPDELLAELDAAGRIGPERMLDAMLRTGPFGDAFGAAQGGLTLDELIAHPHGTDLGPLVPRIPEVLRTPSGKVELAPEAFVADLDRLRAAVPTLLGPGLVLVGRRHLRSNNSWMHNIEVLVKGRPRCTLQVHPDDAARHGLRDGGPARVVAATGSLVVPVEITDGVRPGVVSLPHGWGHDVDGVQLAVATEHAGVSSNVLSDPRSLDPLSGTSVLNGIPVDVTAA